MVHDNDATLARGEDEIPADALPYLKSRKPVGKSRERHAREKVARIGSQVGLSRPATERFLYVRRYAPDLVDLVENDKLGIYQAYKLARVRKEEAELVPEGKRNALTRRATGELRSAILSWESKYGSNDWAEPIVRSLFVAIRQAEDTCERAEKDAQIYLLNYLREHGDE